MRRSGVRIPSSSSGQPPPCPGAAGLSVRRVDAFELRPPGPAPLLEEPTSSRAMGTWSKNIESSSATRSSGIRSSAAPCHSARRRRRAGRRVGRPARGASGHRAPSRSRRPCPGRTRPWRDPPPARACSRCTSPLPRGAGLPPGSRRPAHRRPSAPGCRARAAGRGRPRPPAAARGSHRTRAARPARGAADAPGSRLAGGGRCPRPPRRTPPPRPPAGPDPGQGHAGLGQGADPDQLHDCCRVVAPVAGVVPHRLRKQPLGVVVPHGAHGDPGVRRELADGQHRLSLPQAILRW